MRQYCVSALKERHERTSRSPRDVTDDQEKLFIALEQQYGRRVQYYAGDVYFDCQKLNLNKLEADYLKWVADGRSPAVSPRLRDTAAR